MMKLSIEADGNYVQLSVGGPYSPDVAHDLVARCAEALAAAFVLRDRHEYVTDAEPVDGQDGPYVDVDESTE